MKRVKVTRKNRRQVVPLGSSVPSYTPGIKSTTLAVEVYIGKITTTVTTGVIAQATAIQAALMPNFASRFVLFDEYLIESFKLQVDTCSSNLSGLLNFWFEPNTASNATPTATDAKQNRTLTFAAGSNQKTHTLFFNPRNSATQIWNPITTTNTPIGYLKVYTNTVDYAASTVATDYAVLTGVMRIALRGFG